MSNGIRWQFDEATLYSEERADELKRTILDTGIVKDSENNTLASFCTLLVQTRGVTFDASKVTPRESLKHLPDFLATWQTLPPAELWEYRRKHISHPLWREWANEYSRTVLQLMADPAELPDDALTPVQRDEAARTGSPLT